MVNNAEGSTQNSNLLRIMTREKEIDQRFADLERRAGGGGQGIVELVASLDYRKDSEVIAREYLALLKSGSASRQIGVKILRVLEAVRARDVAGQSIRLSPIGALRRSQWSPEREEITAQQQLFPVDPERLRDYRSMSIPFHRFSVRPSFLQEAAQFFQF